MILHRGLGSTTKPDTEYTAAFWQGRNCDSSPCEGGCNTLIRASGTTNSRHEEIIVDTGLLSYTNEPHVTKHMVCHFGMGLKIDTVLWPASTSLCARLRCTPLEPKEAATKAAAYLPVQDCFMDQQMLWQMDKFHVQTKNTKCRHYRNGKKSRMEFWRKGDKMKTEEYRMVSFSCSGRWAQTAVTTAAGERGWTAAVFPTFMCYHSEPHWEGTSRSIFP